MFVSRNPWTLPEVVWTKGVSAARTAMLELASRRNTATSFDKHILPGATTVDLCLFLYFTPQKVNILLLHRALSETSPTLKIEELESGKYGIPPTGKCERDQ